LILGLKDPGLDPTYVLEKSKSTSRSDNEVD
jgi:hypothetical protein